MSEQLDHYVYVLCRVDGNTRTGPVKVGMASDPDKRLRNLQTASPFKIEQVFCFGCPNKDIARELERSFHEVQSEHRLHGEWFDLEPIVAVHLVCLAYRAMLETTAPPDVHDAALDLAGVLWAEKKFGLAVPKARH